MVELMKRNGDWDDEDEVADPEAEEMAQQQFQQEENNEKPDNIPDQTGDEQMFEQFLKSGDYAYLGKRSRDDFDDEELVFQDKKFKRDSEMDKLI